MRAVTSYTTRFGFLIASALIALGLFQPVWPELPDNTGPILLLLFWAVTFAPLVPLALSIFAILCDNRLPPLLGSVLALLTCVSGLLLALFVAGFSGPGALLMLITGLGLTCAVTGSLKLLTRRDAGHPSRSGALMIAAATAIAIWSLASVPMVVMKANRLAVDGPFCLALHTGSQRPVRSYAELRGVSFYTTSTGYRDTSHWYYHGLLLTGASPNLSVYNWSPRNLRFDPVPGFSQHFSQHIVSIENACEPIPDFWRTLSIA